MQYWFHFFENYHLRICFHQSFKRGHNTYNAISHKTAVYNLRNAMFIFLIALFIFELCRFFTWQLLRDTLYVTLKHDYMIKCILICVIKEKSEQQTGIWKTPTFHMISHAIELVGWKQVHKNMVSVIWVTISHHKLYCYLI